MSEPAGSDTGARGQAGAAYLPGLDGLRALAVIAVLAFHLQYVKGGYLGVDAFFVLSGFLITRLLLDEYRRRGRYSLTRFWSRRVRRLVPALLVLLVAVAAIGSRLSPDLRGTIRSDGTAALLYVANWHAIATSGYFSRLAAPSPFEHLWSLAVEEQFYIVWPLLLLVLLRWWGRRLRTLLAVVAGLAVASYAWMAILYSPGHDPTRVYEGTDTRAGALLLGAALAVWLAVVAARPERPARTVPAHGAHAARAAHAASPSRSRAIPAAGTGLGGFGLRVATVAAVAWLAFAWWRLPGTSAFIYRGGLALCGVSAGVLVLACATGGVASRILSFGPLRSLGKRSYGVYLWHYPILLWLNHARTGWSGLPLNAARVALVLAVAWVSYAVIEMPIRRGSLPRARGALALATSAGAAAAVLVAATVPAAVAPPQSGGAATAGAAAGASPVALAAGLAGALGAGHLGGDATPAVAAPLVPGRHPSAAAPLRVLVMGDSLAWQTGPAISAALQATGQVHIALAAFVGEGFTVSSTHWQTDWPAILAREHPDVVVLSIGIWDWATAQADPAGYGALVNQAVSLVLASGADLLWVEQPNPGPQPERPGVGVFPTSGKPFADRIYQAAVAAYPGRAAWQPTSPTFEPLGVYTAVLAGPGGRLERVRTLDNFHVCPQGAVMLADLVLQGLAPYGLPAPHPGWSTTGGWWKDGRFGASQGGGSCGPPDGTS